jgi:hypothetical protein
LPIGRAAVIAERPPRSTELVISVPISVISVLNAGEDMVVADTAAVLAGCRYVPFAWRDTLHSPRHRGRIDPIGLKAFNYAAADILA